MFFASCAARDVWNLWRVTPQIRLYSDRELSERKVTGGHRLTDTQLTAMRSLLFSVPLAYEYAAAVQKAR